MKIITIPRLELSAAVLLSRLINRVMSELSQPIEAIHAWSDSQTVLAWIASESFRWTVFVANRVAEIQSNRWQLQWHYVPSRENPADVASRGVKPDNLFNLKLGFL